MTPRNRGAAMEKRDKKLVSITLPPHCAARPPKVHVGLFVDTVQKLDALSTRFPDSSCPRLSDSREGKEGRNANHVYSPPAAALLFAYLNLTKNCYSFTWRTKV